MWCLENIPQFKLNHEEQEVYDGVAIMIKKNNMNMTFPVQLMYKHIVNKKALESLETPFVLYNGSVPLVFVPTLRATRMRTRTPALGFALRI